MTWFLKHFVLYGRLIGYDLFEREARIVRVDADVVGPWVCSADCYKLGYVLQYRVHVLVV